jgi:hypothetical protein
MDSKITFKRGIILIAGVLWTFLTIWSCQSKQDKEAKTTTVTGRIHFEEGKYVLFSFRFRQCPYQSKILPIQRFPHESRPSGIDDHSDGSLR